MFQLLPYTPCSALVLKSFGCVKTMLFVFYIKCTETTENIIFFLPLNPFFFAFYTIFMPRFGSTIVSSCWCSFFEFKTHFCSYLYSIIMQNNKEGFNLIMLAAICSSSISFTLESLHCFSLGILEQASSRVGAALHDKPQTLIKGQPWKDAPTLRVLSGLSIIVPSNSSHPNLFSKHSLGRKKNAFSWRGKILNFNIVL